MKGQVWWIIYGGNLMIFVQHLFLLIPTPDHCRFLSVLWGSGMCKAFDRTQVRILPSQQPCKLGILIHTL